MKKRHVIWLFILVVFAASSAAFADNQPKREPWGLWLPHHIDDGAAGGHSAIATIPAGKIFVIESFSAQVGLPRGQKLYILSLELGGNLGAQLFFIPVFLTGSCFDCANGFPADIYTNAQNIRLYVKDTIRSSALRDRSDTNGYGYFSVFVYGYLISANSNTLSP